MSWENSDNHNKDNKKHRCKKEALTPHDDQRPEVATTGEPAIEDEHLEVLEVFNAIRSDNSHIASEVVDDDNGETEDCNVPSASDQEQEEEEGEEQEEEEPVEQEQPALQHHYTIQENHKVGSQFLADIGNEWNLIKKFAKNTKIHKASRQEFAKHTYERLREGPNSSLYSKKQQLEYFAALDIAYHDDKSLKLCLLSYYLEHTREFRKVLLDAVTQDKIPNELDKADLMVGLCRIVHAGKVLADKGYFNTNGLWPNWNIVWTPNILDGKKKGFQYDPEQNEFKLPLAALRWVSEAFYSHFFNCFRILHDTIPRYNFEYIESAVSMATGDNNLNEPKLEPGGWAEYVQKYGYENECEKRRLKREGKKELVNIVVND